VSPPSMTNMEQQQTVHRNACDSCHIRKVRCTTNGPGACQNCQDNFRVCTFSPRDEMGRPKKNGNKRKKTSEKTTARQTATTPSKIPMPPQEPTIPSPLSSESSSNKAQQDVAMPDGFDLFTSELDTMIMNTHFSDEQVPDFSSFR
jgi:ribosomal protein L37AE/L43A